MCVYKHAYTAVVLHMHLILCHKRLQAAAHVITKCTSLHNAFILHASCCIECLINLHYVLSSSLYDLEVPLNASFK
jgi:hypothetical protein